MHILKAASKWGVLKNANWRMVSLNLDEYHIY